MAELLALVAIVLAISVMNKTRKNAAKLTEEIQKLRQEVDALKAGGVAPAASQAVAVEAVEAARAGVSDEGLPQEAALQFPSPWLQASAVSAAPLPQAGEASAALTTGDGATSGAGHAAAVGGSAEGASSSETAPVRESLESRIGARWAVWVGGLALALGGVFMVKYAIESGMLSPAVRLSLAALFGLMLIAAGEFIRRRAQPLIANAFQNAMIPGILTAAGALTLFGVTYAAHGFYGYFGAPAAFLLLAAVAFVTIALSLLHGQALAGLGLLASMVTPLLIAVPEPDPWRLFGYLSLTWLATIAASRLRRWQVVPTLANAGLGLWAFLYLAAAEPLAILPLTLALVVMLIGIALIWPGSDIGAGEATDNATRQEDALAEDRESEALPANAATAGLAAEPVAARWQRWLSPAWVPVSLSAALATVVPAIILAFIHPFPASAMAGFVALVLALAAVGAVRAWALYPAILGALCALSGTMVIAGLPGFAVGMLDRSAAYESATSLPALADTAPVNLILLLSAGFAAIGAAALRLWKERAPGYAALWSMLMAIFPLAIMAVSFLAFGNLSFDLKHGLVALVFGLAYFAGAEFFSRRLPAADAAPVPQWLLVSGGFGFLVLALFALTDGLATTLLVAVFGLAMVFATRFRAWPVLPWMMVGSALVVAIRIAWEPTIIGAANLSRTPVFNQLLAGYGVPALLLAVAAYELRHWPYERVRNLLQALASLFVLLAVAILVRHAMNGGVLDSAVPTLGEQSIYTLLAAGASAIFMTLDLKSPSPVFRYGSMVVGALSMLSILSAHFFALNPYFTGELTGRWPFFNLLLVGYLLPGLAFAGLTWYARGRRPAAYVMLLALTGVALAFAWLSLSVRRYWHGEGIADWKGFLQGETYTYSVVWLLLGVVLLVLGSRFDAKSIRLASAALVLIAVIKVFLFDMANLEGILRALSFIGLGAVLIGIGLFYQKILSGKDGERVTAGPPGG
ncbi:DUF2339 domain-containing protein [Rhizobium sp. ARZ01]|uniref:DUF2339 domain-containing protein n=1 Tax=Rhizobium sp. ARZ01 TaxID=2769313 RepID=UPI0017807FC3|nr:DUF2339 domain-containing protein [Rhizobium sp. ARZ01]MBD9371646.1 DUF2339 domain-containing protein [Rhizobium sp. ARZ01]